MCSSPSGWRPGPTPPRSGAATPTTTGPWLSGPTSRCGALGQEQWAERLQADAGNLAAAVRWYLANDPGPLPHLFRVLWPFWSQRDQLGEARSWIDQLLPSADALDPQARAELLWTVVVTAREVGDDEMALSARGAPGTAAGWDLRPVPARGVPAGHGVDLTDSR